jgi:DNA-binding NarL/FixJ family response regulator
MIAQICSWLLYTLEQSIFLHNQSHDLDTKIPSPLTKREQEVLSLMCKGYSKEAISSTLSITVATVGKHRQHIYEQLGVHNERDALLVAYRNGLFSIVDKG